MLFFSSNFLSISSSLISSTLMLSTAPSLDNFLNYILHCTYIPQPPPTRREQQSYSPELLDYALQRSCSLRGRISHHNKRVNVPYCEAQGKGRAKGWPRKVTQRSFIDGEWWISFPWCFTLGASPQGSIHHQMVSESWNFTDRVQMGALREKYF